MSYVELILKARPFDRRFQIGFIYIHDVTPSSRCYGNQEIGGEAVRKLVDGLFVNLPLPGRHLRCRPLVPLATKPPTRVSKCFVVLDIDNYAPILYEQAL